LIDSRNYRVSRKLHFFS